MSDYYRDRVRHGGILSNKFIGFWWNRQVVSYQYGLAGRSNPRQGLVGGAAKQWGEETIEGSLTEEELRENRQDQTIDTAKYKFRDEDYYSSKEYKLEDIEVPVLSVANWV
jgi:predicted acyl esterase